MSFAPNYSPTVGFATEESNSVAGRSTVRTVAVDNELANISSSINGLNTNLKLLQRDDGKFKDAILEPYALSEQTRALIAASGCNPRGLWEQNTSYARLDIIQYSNTAQICLEAHNSGTVFTQSYWLPISGDGTSAANAAAAAASALAASNSEIAASISSTSASNSAIAADASADAAAISETNAANSAASAASVISGSVVPASQAEAEAGTENTKFMSALRVAQAIASRSGGKIQASVAANALTITLNPTSLDFRSPTLGSGAVNTRTLAAAISMTVSSGSSLGTVNATAARLALLAIDNAGTVELAITNLSGGVNLDETTLISTTAEGGAGAADSASVIYSTTARTNVPFRIVGFIDITEATAGTWATSPSRIQGAVGNSLASILGFGNGQTWQALAGSRSFGTTYYNTTGKPIAVAINFQGTSATSNATLVINGITVGNYGTSATPSGFNSQLFGIVPPGGSYVCSVTNCSISYWAELR